MSGMTEAQIMQLHKLTSSQLQRLVRRMMVAGYLSELELFDWLRLTDSELMQVFREENGDEENLTTVSNIEFVTPAEIVDITKAGSIAKDLAASSIVLKRIPVRLPLEVLGHHHWNGFVRDLSENEIRVASTATISCNAGDRKVLVLRADLIGQMETVELEAACQWIKKKVRRVEYFMTGFKITRISINELDKLRSLIRLLSEDLPREKETPKDTMSGNTTFEMTDEFVLDGSKIFSAIHKES